MLGVATPDQAYPDHSVKKGAYGSQSKKKERSATPILEPEDQSYRQQKHARGKPRQPNAMQNNFG